MTKKNRAPRRPKKSEKSDQLPASRERGSYNHSKEFLEKQHARQDAFLKALRLTKGRQMEACEISGVSIDTVLDWREDENSDFQKRFLRAIEIVPIAALDEAIRRGVDGYEGRPVLMPVWDKKLGKRVVKLIPMREYSDAMLAKVLSAHDRRFRPGEIEIDPAGGDGKLVIKIVSYADGNNRPS